MDNVHKDRETHVAFDRHLLKGKAGFLKLTVSVTRRPGRIAAGRSRNAAAGTLGSAASFWPYWPWRAARRPATSWTTCCWWRASGRVGGRCPCGGRADWEWRSARGWQWCGGTPASTGQGWLGPPWQWSFLQPVKERGLCLLQNIHKIQYSLLVKCP